MKVIYKYSVLLFILFSMSCSEDDKLSGEVLDDVIRGAILRTVNVISPAMDVLDPGAVWGVEIEAQDIENGALMEEVRLYAKLIDNTPENGTTDSGEVQIDTFSPSDFTNGPFGLPRREVTATLGELTSALGLAAGEFNCGDQIEMRFEMDLTTGQTFTGGDQNPNISGGNFFSSPYVYRATLIALLPSDDLFTGQYQLTTVTPGIFGVNDYQDGVYTIDAIGNTTRVIRSVPTFPAFGPFGPVDFEFQFVCGEIIVTPAQSVGAGCNATIATGTASVNTTYDLNNPDDSSFIINFTSDESNDCGTGSPQASIQLTKL
ncbi:hypothetical protein [Flagellimonas sp.]|uniref:hypothetical protein n=1 Tax=Flagellimonas sp. TaxID=2058762 RepID=UPI003B512250